MQNSIKLEQKSFFGTFGKRKITVIQPCCLIFNHQAAEELKLVVENCLALDAASEATLLVDMQNVESVDSKGLTILLSILKVAIVLRTSLVLCSLKPQVHLVFEISRMDRTFTIFENYDAFVTHIEIKAELDALQVIPEVKILASI